MIKRPTPGEDDLEEAEVSLCDFVVLFLPALDVLSRRPLSTEKAQYVTKHDQTLPEDIYIHFLSWPISQNPCLQASFFRGGVESATKAIRVTRKRTHDIDVGPEPADTGKRKLLCTCEIKQASETPLTCLQCKIVTWKPCCQNSVAKSGQWGVICILQHTDNLPLDSDGYFHKQQQASKMTNSGSATKAPQSFQKIVCPRPSNDSFTGAHSRSDGKDIKEDASESDPSPGIPGVLGKITERQIRFPPTAPKAGVPGQSFPAAVHRRQSKVT